MNGLSVTVLCALDEQRHNPGRYSSSTLPTERLRVKEQPSCDVDANDDKRQRMRRRHPYLGKPRTILHHRWETVLLRRSSFDVASRKRLGPTGRAHFFLVAKY